MGKRITVEYQGETMSAAELAKRIGVTQTCIAKRWGRGRRGADLVAPSQKGRGQSPGKTTDQRNAFEVAQRQRQAERTAVERSLDLRRRARDRVMQVRREHAAAFGQPLIDAKLMTPAERAENAQKVKGRQRWNGGWFGESHESREVR